MVCLGLCMEQQPCPLINTGGAFSPLSTTLFQFALVCSLCASFDPAGQPLESELELLMASTKSMCLYSYSSIKLCAYCTCSCVRVQ